MKTPYTLCIVQKARFMNKLFFVKLTDKVAVLEAVQHAVTKYTALDQVASMLLNQRQVLDSLVTSIHPAVRFDI